VILQVYLDLPLADTSALGRMCLFSDQWKKKAQKVPHAFAEALTAASSLIIRAMNSPSITVD